MAAAMVENCWNALCSLAQAVRAWDKPIDFCSLRFGAEEAVRINAVLGPQEGCSTVTLGLNVRFDMELEVTAQGGAYFILEDFIRVMVVSTETLSPDVQRLICIYAPYCFAAMHARRWQRAFAVSHFAQSLDGRIATVTGDSKWIGSDENLIHAHRMRALCDGILIGANTLKRDTPALTVRHVQGENPQRIVVGSSIEGLDCLIQASPEPIVVVGPQVPSPNRHIRTVTVPRDNGLISGVPLLQALYQQGIFSVYIEGGSITTSHFLSEEAIDVVQLHIAPMILGSGVSAFMMPQITHVTDSVRFVSHQFVPMDDHMMFVGTTQRFNAQDTV